MKQGLFALCMTGFIGLTGSLEAQLSERPGTSVDTSLGAKDLSGYSIKSPRVRVVHTQDLAEVGGSFYLQNIDPFLAYKMGKDLTQREFRLRDGVFSLTEDGGIAEFAGTLSDGFTPAITSNDQVSCGGCHASPYRDAGAGTNFAKKSGLGRNAPHFYGAGLMEMLAWQLRQKLLAQIDINRNGWVDLHEIQDLALYVQPTEHSKGIYYGSPGDRDGDGRPDLNDLIRVWYVDKEGRYLAEAQSLDSDGVYGYNIAIDVFGWGEQRHGLNLTNRQFVSDPFHAHTGLQAYDPTLSLDPDGDGLSQISNAGLQQFTVSHNTGDGGDYMSDMGLSMDDPDGDGVINEVSQGDLDLIEWYMLHSPRPAVGRMGPFARRGSRLFDEWQCSSCHVMDWTLEEAQPENPDIHQQYLGDLRIFDLDVSWNRLNQRLEGQLHTLYTLDPLEGTVKPKRGSFQVEGIGTDFKKHEMGPEFWDMQFDGAVLTSFRTAPLWGNGTTGGPWGHDGASFTLDHVIRRHGGEALKSAEAYRSASIDEQESLLSFLRTMQLYSTDRVPTDIDGDGKISPAFEVQGQSTGQERFNAEWLFRVPGRIEGPVQNPGGRTVQSSALTNVIDAYGLLLPYLVDSDQDGFADVQDPCPIVTGYQNGCD